MDALAERHIGEIGSTEAHWSAALAEVQWVALDLFVAAHARLVVVAPHPDDEVLACGGLLAAHTGRGGRASVIAVTDGEASHRGTESWAPRALAAARQAESDRGLRALGVLSNEITRLTMPDGAVSRYGGPLREALGLLLKSDDVVVSTWRLDGHPDHEAVGAATEDVCADVGAVCLQAPVWMWHWSSQGDARVPWHRLRGFALDSHACQRKRAALAMHETQLMPRSKSEGPVLGPLILERATRDAEYFFVNT